MNAYEWSSVHGVGDIRGIYYFFPTVMPSLENFSIAKGSPFMHKTPLEYSMSDWLNAFPRIMHKHVITFQEQPQLSLGPTLGRMKGISIYHNA